MQQGNTSHALQNRGAPTQEFWKIPEVVIGPSRYGSPGLARWRRCTSPAGLSPPPPAADGFHRSELLFIFDPPLTIRGTCRSACKTVGQVQKQALQIDLIEPYCTVFLINCQRDFLIAGGLHVGALAKDVDRSAEVACGLGGVVCTNQRCRPGPSYLLGQRYACED